MVWQRVLNFRTKASETFFFQILLDLNLEFQDLVYTSLVLDGN